MGAIFNVSLLILAAFLSGQMVLSFDDPELSSVSHNRQKRMDGQSEAITMHDLPPLLAHDLHVVNMTAPTKVAITKRGSFAGYGYAIHPYLVVTRREFLGQDLQYGVLMYIKHERIYLPQRVENFFPDATNKFVVIELVDPVLMNKPVRRAFSKEGYPKAATDWAYFIARRWIRRQLLYRRHILEQKLNEIHINEPTEVQITSNGEPVGPGFAIHPYIVITRPHFIRERYGVATHMISTRELQPHRIQIQYTNTHYNIVVIQLLDPILLKFDASDAFSRQHYSDEAVAWAFYMAESWEHVMLSQQHFYRENLVM